MPDFRAAMEQSNQETRSELSKILLPHQLKRLEQLAMQMQTRGGGTAVLGGEVGQQLGVTEQQRAQLQPKVDEVERESRKKTAEIRRQAQDQVISLLTPEQQAKFRELVGEPFEFQIESPAPGRPFGGDPRAPQPPRNN